MMLKKYYIFLQKQILLMIGLSLIPGIVYVIFGWIFDHFWPSFIWYMLLLFILSLYGLHLYGKFENNKMNDEVLREWYNKLILFMYLIFFSWVAIFIINVQYSEHNMHYIAIFTELGAAVVAAALLVSDKKLYIPIIIMLMLPLTVYFILLDIWYGYILSVFSLIFLGVLLYAASNTNKLLLTNHHNSIHDILTGLYNRRYFIDYIEELSIRLEDNNEIVYIYLIDLDYFKDINNSLGHEIGDKLLKVLAERLKTYTKNSHKLIRLGGDEFILISKELRQSQETDDTAYAFATALLEIIKQPFTIEEHLLYISASIGVHNVDTLSIDKKTFFQEVDIAMYDAKSKGRNIVVVFSEQLSQVVKRKLLIEQKLFHALENNLLDIYLQPQFNVQEHLVGCEALLRWTDDELGELNPCEFIQISEKSGLILKLGTYVIERAFVILSEWNAAGNYMQQFSINISIQQLNDIVFIEEVERLYTLYFEDLSEQQTIVFEITEYVFSKNLSQTIQHMYKLKQLGIRFSIDDFGTGYSSLSYLQNLPIDELKIDRTFVAKLSENESSINMIASIISIAKNFNFTVVAEGIETKEQLTTLIEQNCDMFQGFYFDKALPKEAFEKKYLT